MQRGVRQLNDISEIQGNYIAYWMSRDQRAHDNWALLYAQHLSHKNHLPLVVLFALSPTFPSATHRTYEFMLKGLQEVEHDLAQKNIPFIIKMGDPTTVIPQLVKKYSIAALVTDFSPLNIGRTWRDAVSSEIDRPFYEVDAHNIVPCWAASDKQEYAARTFRPKIHEKLDDYLTDFPALKKQEPPRGKAPRVNWKRIDTQLGYDTSVKPVDWITPGSAAAKKMLGTFISEKLDGYAEHRNDPTLDALSNQSPYLHFGHIASQRVALEVKKAGAPKKDIDAYLEELIVRKELSDNFCFYQKHYDSFNGFPDWAQKSLTKHASDRREYLYSYDELEQGKTHDNAWNTAQKELRDRGKMHGYMRMYWAKKILEWTKSPQEAQKIAIKLNDTYFLDGRDPNGYTGIAWSIGGVHDRGWGERSIFGKVRYMNYNGLKRKFDVEKYSESQSYL